MDGLVDVTIPVEAEIAAALSDPVKRERAGRLLSRMLRPRPDADPLIEALVELKQQVHIAGLTDEIVFAASAFVEAILKTRQRAGTCAAPRAPHRRHRAVA